MARCFYITITKDTDPGIYSVYYGLPPFRNYAKLLGSENNAINIPYDDFITGSGLGICVPDGVEDVVLYICSLFCGVFVPMPTLPA